MAKDEKTVAPAAGEAAPAKSKGKKLITILLGIVLVLVLAGGGAAFMISKKKHAALEEEETVTESDSNDKKSSHATAPVFVVLEPFTVNLTPDGPADQYLQTTLALELMSSEADKQIKDMAPKIRHDVTMVLSAKKASEILSKEGKENLSESLKEEINKILSPKKKGKDSKPSEGPVISVLFNSFIIQ